MDRGRGCRCGSRGRRGNGGRGRVGPIFTTNSTRGGEVANHATDHATNATSTSTSTSTSTCASTTLDNVSQITGPVEHMSPVERRRLLVGDSSWTAAYTRIFMSDGPHGVNTRHHQKRFATTSFPTGINLASSWDTQLISEVGKSIGEEATSIGVNMLLGPCVNIVRHPLGGRTFESFSEDPFLASRTCVSFISGLHSVGVASCVKHFACNNQEEFRKQANVIVTERALREIYLPAFEAAVLEARVDAVMSAYNIVNGQYCSANKYLLTEILRDEWNFGGVVVSDWGAARVIGPCIMSGLDLKMPGPPSADDMTALRSIPDKIVDRSGERILNLASRLKTKAPKNPDTRKHAETATSAAAESFVLLKNANGILPLKCDTIHSLIVCGPNSHSLTISGAGSAAIPQFVEVNPAATLHAALPPHINFQHVASTNNNPKAFVHADIVVFFAGAPPLYEGEKRDRPSLNLPFDQDRDITEIARANPRTIVVVEIGSAFAAPWLSEVAAVLWVGYPGCCGDRAIASVLLGGTNPCGKLPVTFPRCIEDCAANQSYPCNKEAKGGRRAQVNVSYAEDIFVGYRQYDSATEPLFCFGFGLSYTTFQYSDIAVSSATLKIIKQPNAPDSLGAPLQVTCSVSNTGTSFGKEVVQLYVRAPSTPEVPRPEKELKGFTKIGLDPKQTHAVTFTLLPRDFSYWGTQAHSWLISAGDYLIQICASSRDIRLTIPLSIVGSN
ncbi:glycosyl hydrolase [Pelomyxa schiedti]|nr:glycosyl hydrolase [Pelomyxa schiedti]